GRGAGAGGVRPTADRGDAPADRPPAARTDRGVARVPGRRPPTMLRRRVGVGQRPARPERVLRPPAQPGLAPRPPPVRRNTRPPGHGPRRPATLPGPPPRRRTASRLVAADVPTRRRPPPRSRSRVRRGRHRPPVGVRPGARGETSPGRPTTRG